MPSFNAKQSNVESSSFKGGSNSFKDDSRENNGLLDVNDQQW